MPRIYTEIRITHATEYERMVFKEQIKEQAEKVGQDVAGYIRLIISLDAATGIIAALRDFTSAIEEGILRGSGISEPVGIFGKDDEK